MNIALLAMFLICFGRGVHEARACAMAWRSGHAHCVYVRINRLVLARKILLKTKFQNKNFSGRFRKHYWERYIDLTVEKILSKLRWIKFEMKSSRNLMQEDFIWTNFFSAAILGISFGDFIFLSLSFCPFNQSNTCYRERWRKRLSNDFNPHICSFLALAHVIKWVEREKDEFLGGPVPCITWL